MIGQKKIFNYPDFGTPDNHPDYTAHRGAIVIVLSHNECHEGQNLYNIQAEDGWKGVAWGDELADLPKEA